METLLQKCQREAKEKIINDPDYSLMAITEDLIDTIIANTLKQAVEALEEMKKEVNNSKHAGKSWCPDCEDVGFNYALTDAQNLLLGEDNDNV
jgi:hypothetical protein